jgi:hypothetical protein
MNKLTRRREEFFKFVWDHSADSFQAKFDKRRELTPSEISFLKKITDGLREKKSRPEISKLIKKELLVSEDDMMVLLLQLTGLTRTKIIGDLKASQHVKSSGVKVPNDYKRLHEGEIWNFAGPYLTDRFTAVFGPVARSSHDIALSAESINQATYPGFIRQERAKRQGHEAELRLATLLLSAGIPFEPREKADNPMCKDATVAGVSFDIVIPSVSNPLLCFKATVHTANIGQYGESKDDLEVKEAKEKLSFKFGSKAPLIIALIDGNGYSSNRAGLDGVLCTADEFCQFRTLWKALVIAFNKLGLDTKKIKILLPDESAEDFSDFLKTYNLSDQIIKSPPTKGNWRRIDAGDAEIYLLES